MSNTIKVTSFEIKCLNLKFEENEIGNRWSVYSMNDTVKEIYKDDMILVLKQAIELLEEQ